MESNLGANIKNFRKNKGYTQEELAGMLGVTPQAVSRWESEAGLPFVIAGGAAASFGATALFDFSVFRVFPDGISFGIGDVGPAQTLCICT